MKKLIFALVAGSLALAPATVDARSLSPDEALALTTAQVRKSLGAASELQLAYSLPSEQNGQNALYVFANPQGGFAVVAADDDVDNLLLGYSDGALDVDNRPPAFDWYLRATAAAVDGQIARAANGRQFVNAADAQRAAIAPLITTKWDQGDPYNQQCPIVAGGRSVTGCVATAMAQIMNYHKYPTTGTGSHSYTWKVNNTNYTDAMDFSTVTFDWGNMLDRYTSSATQAQKDAVAQLMHACGVSVDMGYTPNESGADTSVAAQSLIKYFGYDKGVSALNAEWFTISEWNDIIYQELAQGRPVLYSGRDINDAGHAFVCDGYSSDNMFHINWGWSGASDGFFILPDLYPATMGTGGGSGQSGFNFDQQAFIGIRPDAGGTSAPMIRVWELLGTNKTSYNRASESVTITGDFYSSAMEQMSYTLGLHLVGDDIDQYITWGNTTLNLNQGYSSLSFAGSKFPVGTYYVRPVFKTPTTAWQDMGWNKREQPNGLLFQVTSTTINASAPTQDVEIDAEIVELRSTVTGATGIYTGMTYEVDFDITANAEYAGTMQAALLVENSSGGYSITTAGPSRTVVFPEAGTQTETFSLPIQSQLTPGRYLLALTEYKDGYCIICAYNVQVEAYVTQGKGQVALVEYNDKVVSLDSDDPTIISYDNTEVGLWLQCTEAPWSEPVMLVIFDAETRTYAGETEPVLAEISSVGDYKGYLVDLGNLGLDYDHTYFMVGWGDTNGQTLDHYWFYFQLSNDITITDAEAYTNSEDIEGVDISYVRNFTNTAWQPLYVPFDMAYADWADKAEVAMLEGVIMYDNDKDGVIERTVVTFTSVNSGIIHANVPYLIRAKAEGETTFTVTDATLKAAADNYVDCTTTSHNFYLRGVYERNEYLSAEDHYIMKDGHFYHTSAGVKPMRFYLEKEARPEYGSHAPRRTAGDPADDVIYVEVDGVVTDGILDIIATEADDATLYDLQGRRVIDPASGIYIRGGKKVIIK